MEIKVGQWFRAYDGYIRQCKDVIPYVKNGKMWYLTQNYYNEVVKVADTPQELINANDLVEVDGYEDAIYKVHDIDELGRLDLCSMTFTVTPQRIKKILTPNSNGGYDLQWEETK